MADVEHDYGDPSGFLERADDVLQDCLDEFGVRASWKSAGAEPTLIPNGGIFREVHREVDPMTGATVTSQTPTLDVRRTEIPPEDELTDDDRVLVSGRTFEVRDVQKDGEVGAKLILHEITP